MTGVVAGVAARIKQFVRGMARGLVTRGGLWPKLGAALLLVGAGAITLSYSFDTPVVGERLDPVSPVNSGATDPADISAHNSPTVERSPIDGRKLAVANRIDTPRYSCALHTSSDAGATWSQTAVPAPAGERVCYAPDIAFGADGTLYVSYVTLRGIGNVPNAAWLVHSTDGGKTLSEPQRVLGRLPFQVRLEADSERAGRLYLTWLQASDVGLYRFTEAGNPIRTKRSDDGGESWGASTRVSSAEHARALAPSTAVGPDGDLYVLFLDLGDDRLDYEGGHGGMGGAPYPGRWKLVLARSEDAGATWEESTVEDQLVPTERFLVFIPPFPSLAIDDDSGRVYAGFHDGRLGDADVWVWSRGESETEWKGPTRVNDTQQRDATEQYLPKLAVAPVGRLDVVYYDRRMDPDDNVMNEVSLQSSSDQGDSFGERIRLSDKPFSSRIGFGSERDMPDLGSRLGLLSTDSRAFAVWTDTRGGTFASNKQDLARAVVAFSDPARLSKPVELLLRFGGLALALLGLLLMVRGILRPSPASA